MDTTLKGKNPTRNECAHIVIYCKLVMLTKLLDEPDNPICFMVGIFRVEDPISFGRLTRNICRQVNKVSGSRVLGVEEGMLPFPARF